MGRRHGSRRAANSDFRARSCPYLERNLELARRYVDCFDGFDCAYDVLLDDFEPGMTTAEVAALFDELKAGLRPMVATLAQNADRVDDSPPARDFPIDRQRRLARGVVERMGFDRESWRMDDAVHPFATGLGSHDVRITTRWDETYFPSSLYGAMHECGHGLYEAGIADSLAAHARSASGESLGDPRVPEPDVGEHGRPRPRVRRRARRTLRGDPRRLGRVARRRRSVPRRQPRARRPTSGWRPTRSPTACTSSCASSSSRT